MDHKTAIVWDPVFAAYNGGAGPAWIGGMPDSETFDQPDTVARAYDMIKEVSLTETCLILGCDAVTEGDLAVQHDSDYVDRVKALSEGDGGDAGFLAHVPPGGFDILLKATGSALAAFRAVLSGQAQNAYAFARPGGHHAMRNMGLGNAVFAHVATALTLARKEFDIPRVAILDWDVHHGNGTESRFIEDPNTLFISIHQDRCFPKDTGGLEVRGAGPGFGANINIPLPPGSGHEAYLATMNRVVIPAIDRFAPDFIVLSNGVDANGNDPLGRMMCHAGTFREMTDLLLSAADRHCDGRLLVCHEGGYSAQLAPWCVLAVIEALAGNPVRDLDGLSWWVSANGGHELKPTEEDVIKTAEAYLSDVPQCEGAVLGT